MTDRELLELAAKAAGIVITDDHYWNDGAGQWVRWNPLESDGDALRLAVTLGFINPGQWPSVSHVADRMLRETNNVDWYAATRRAIVLAAAEIGRNMT